VIDNLADCVVLREVATKHRHARSQWLTTVRASYYPGWRAILLTSPRVRRQRFPRFIRRALSDSPNPDSFCRVAPSDRLRVRAILETGVFWRTSPLSSRTSAAVQARRFAAVLAISVPFLTLGSVSYII
jgi:hypothetical protein